LYARRLVRAIGATSERRVRRATKRPGIARTPPRLTIAAMSLTKAEIARLRSLREKKHRVVLNQYIVEGPKVVAELLAAGHRFDALYHTAAWQPSVTPPDAHPITQELMARISHFPTPSPVLAVGRIEPTALAPQELEQGLTLALDGIQDPGNVGTLLRVAD